MRSFFNHFDKCIHDPSWYPACFKTTLFNCSDEEIKQVQNGIWLKTWCGGSTVWYVVDSMLTRLHRVTYELAKYVLPTSYALSNTGRKEELLSSPMYQMSLLIGSLGISFLCYRGLFSHPPVKYIAPEYQSCRNRICRIADTVFGASLFKLCIFFGSSWSSMIAVLNARNDSWPSAKLACFGVILAGAILYKESVISGEKKKLREETENKRNLLRIELENVFSGESLIQSFFDNNNDLTLLSRKERQLLEGKIKEIPVARIKNYLMGQAYKFGISGAVNHPKAIECWEKAYQLGDYAAGKELVNAYTNGTCGVRANSITAEKYKNIKSSEPESEGIT